MTKTILGFPEEEFFVSGHNACAGCGAAIIARLITKIAGKNTIICQATGCLEVVSTLYPYTSWKLPWIHVAFENAAAVASGVYRALKVLGKDKEINVIALAGDGGSYDIGFQALSGALERREKICYIVYDNEAYMNTGIQRSGATPKFAQTTTTYAGKKEKGKFEWKKPLPFICAAHGIPYVATASPAYLADLKMKLEKALKKENQPSVLVIISPCPVGWGFDSSETIEIARLAVETGIWPLYEIEKGVFKLTVKQKTKPVSEYIRRQGRFSHLTEEDIKEIQETIDRLWEYYKSIDGKKIFEVIQ